MSAGVALTALLADPAAIAGLVERAVRVLGEVRKIQAASRAGELDVAQVHARFLAIDVGSTDEEIAAGLARGGDPADGAPV